jgi:hypothetical protein
LNVVQHRCARGNHQRIGEYFVKMQIFPQKRSRRTIQCATVSRHGLD